MASQFVDEVYPKSHILKVKAIDTLIAIIGLALAVSPFVEHAFPGDIDTTAHVAVGTLIFACGVFRAGIAYGSIWLEVVIFALGLIALCMPRMQHMQWNEKYNLAHLAAGGLCMLLAVVSGAITVPVLKKRPQA